MQLLIVSSLIFALSAAIEFNGTENSGALNKYYLGAAFETGLRDLSDNPNDWSTSRSKTGYWLHPMGFEAARKHGYAKTLLSHYQVKSYIYEADLLAWTDGSNPTQTNSPWCWGQWLEEIDPSFKQALFAPWVAGDRIAKELQDVTNRYIDVSNRMKSKGYDQTYFFYSPPSPEAISSVDALLNGRVDNVPYVEYVIKRAGLKGIALDYPAGLYLSKEFGTQYPAGSADKCRQLAKQAWDIAQRNKIPLVWVFNGKDSNTLQAKNAIIKDGINPSTWAVDNFADSSRRGTPESSTASLSGQIKQLL